MQVVEFLVAADGVHVRVNAVARADPVAADRHALPLGKRLHDLCVCLIHIQNGKVDCAFHTVQVVIQSTLRCDEQRCGYTAQVETISQLLLEVVLDLFDRTLRLHVVQKRRIPFGDEQF